MLEELISNLSQHILNHMVKGYWEKRFKKELAEEGDKLQEEIEEAAHKKLEELTDSEPES